VTTIFNHRVSQPVAVFKNAAFNEIAFSDFDSDQSTPRYAFNISGSGSYTPVGSHAGNAQGLASTQTMTSPTLTKNTLAANYIFSIWINAATAGTLTLTVPGVSPAPTISYANKGWQYYELKIPAKNISASFAMSFVASNNISIDDILLYPDVAEAITSTYDPVSHYVLAVTNTNGVSSYFTHDTWGRITYQYDQDHNIVKKNTYVTSGEVKDFGNLSISINNLTTTIHYPNTPVAFGILGVDASSGATATWNFGDGTSPVTTSLNTSPTHTYTLFGTYTVTATVNSPIFGSKTVTTSAVITPANIALSFINSLPTGTGNMTSIQFQQGGVTKYSFGPSTISGATVPQGNYTIVLTISNPVHHTNFSAGILADCWQVCSIYTSATTLTYTYTANLSTCTTLQVSLNSTTTCPGPM
ncbi:MAG: PKD domain-containing protein, partial [Mucilaginibacter sp.]